MATVKIEIFGTGCPKCKALEKSAREAVAQLGIEAEIIKIERLEEIIGRGILLTPAIAIDGTIKSGGRVLSVADVEQLLT